MAAAARAALGLLCFEDSVRKKVCLESPPTRARCLLTALTLCTAVMAHDAGGPSGVIYAVSEQSMSLQSEQVGELQEDAEEEVEEDDMELDVPLSQAVETDSED